MLKVKHALLPLIFCLFSSYSFSQTILLSGQLGYYSPQGDAFSNPTTGSDLSSFGLGIDMEALYFLPNMDDKIGVGLTYSSAILIGSEDDNITDIGIYGLSLYGVKGQYRLSGFEKSVTPFGSLALGLSQFTTPDITSGQTTIVSGGSSSAFGIKPEIGIDFGGFVISAAYFVPMSYEIESGTGNFDGTAGAFSVSIGYSTNFEF